MKKFLLVDDAKTVRFICTSIVRSCGCDTLEAENGREALDVMRAHPDIDVILLDWNMPVMDGLTFLKRLRGESLPRQPHVVMCTTENEFERAAEAMQAGANDYIVKPVTGEFIREKLKEISALCD